VESLKAFHVAGTGTVRISGFAQTRAVTLSLPAGSYVLHARIHIRNLDTAPQFARAFLQVRSTLSFVDQLEQFVTQNTEDWPFYLQGVVKLPKLDRIDLLAATFDGWHRSPSLIALTVDQLVPSV
jgi:hypothetical protein